MMCVSLFKLAGDAYGPGIKGGRVSSGPNNDDARTVYDIQGFCGMTCNHGSELYHCTCLGHNITK
jgi:hypothetical protein